MIPVVYSFRSLLVRKTTTAAAVTGIALVVFVMGAALMLVAGLNRAMSLAGKPDRVIVLRQGSDAELSSGFTVDNLLLLAGGPGVKKAADGHPLVMGEVVVVAAMKKVGSDDGITNVTIRGVAENILQFRSEAKIVQGVAAKPATNEAIIGKAILGRIEGLELGQTFDLRKNRPVKIVGVFDDGGSAYESEVWADVDQVRSAFGRDGSVSSARVMLDSPAGYEVFKTFVEGDKRLGLQATDEPKYYKDQGQATGAFVAGLGISIAVFFAIGAMIGAMITMYASVSNRSREIGTLRALGFSRFQVLVAFILEALAMAAVGGVIGTVLSLFMGAVHFSMVNQASWSEIVFSFDPTPKILGVSMIFAAVMGLLGGLLPAIQAARISPVAAMRN